MKTGMLWFDNDGTRSLEAKLNRAIQYYETKYGIRPNACYVHPSMLVEGIPDLADVVIEGSNTVLPHHFWLGNEEQAAQPLVA